MSASGKAAPEATLHRHYVRLDGHLRRLGAAMGTVLGGGSPPAR